MSYIKFFSNYVFDRDNENPEAIFIDTRRNKTIMFNDITKKDVMQIFSQSWEEINSSDLYRVARALLKRGVAYLSEGDYTQSVFNDDMEDRLFEQRMINWWEQTRNTAIASSKLQKVYLSA